MLLRRRIDLADPEIEGSMQPYHAAERLALPAARELVRRFEKGSRGLALESFRTAIAETEKSGGNVVACGLLLSSGQPLGALANTLASHARIHTADGEHFRDAIARAAERHGLRVTRVRERDVWETAAEKMKVSVETFQKRIAALGKTLGPPWRADEKLATVAACLALANLPVR